MSVNFQTIINVINFNVYCNINFLIFILYLVILYKYVYVPKKIDFKGFINKTFNFFTFGYLKLPKLLLNISNLLAVMGTIFLIAILIFIVINIIILGPMTPLFPYFSEPIKIAVLFIVFIYGLLRLVKYLRNIEGFQGYDNINVLNDINNVNKNELITLVSNKRVIPKSSKDITVSKEAFQNKNNIEDYEGSNVKMYSNIY